MKYFKVVIGYGIYSENIRVPLIPSVLVKNMEWWSTMPHIFLPEKALKFQPAHPHHSNNGQKKVFIILLIKLFNLVSSNSGKNCQNYHF